ncbi:MAG TPA: hypothetical protein PK667_01480 [Nitrosomonas europaea]|uniref:DUF1302 family protein n=1 Tax=Nitrosomonas europaea TaxID=915 RepID=UPI00248F6EDE|nr:DUF1302 family protein [Nitrosomonas europaea]HRO55650.1 hypothetical protein [Nitrosomonas europaea]HUM72853.1 hypothetical protein [Nitrosomonas europaea]
MILYPRSAVLDCFDTASSQRRGVVASASFSQITGQSVGKIGVLFLLLMVLWSANLCNSSDITPLSANRANVGQMVQAFTFDDLFKEDGPSSDPPQRVFRQTSSWRGFSQLEFAETIASPKHASKLRLRSELSNLGQLSPNVKWKLSARIDYDAIYDLSDFYSRQVRRDQRFELFLRENYLDFSIADFDVRVGRQHIVWGEMVGLFFADVVSAKDMREFVLPDFDILRIPQWAVRTEYSKNDFHADLIWIPFASLDEIGRPGADFYPFKLPVAAPVSFLKEDRSGRNVAHSNYGIRLSQLANGWDVSAFYYHSLDATPTFHRISQPWEPLLFQARHNEIDQAGGTVTKDLGSVVLKGEFVYTHGRRFNVTRPTAADGLVRQDTIDYALGLDFTLPSDIRLNLQFFQRAYLNYDRDIFQDRLENGGSIFLQGDLWRDFQGQILLIHSFNRNEWMLRPRLTWNFARNWKLAAGADIFNGPPTGLFGRFDSSDRVYTELRFSF